MMERRTIRKLNEIFTKVQSSISTHKKCCMILQTIYVETNFEEFVESFVKYLKALLLEDDHNNNPYINRALKFCVQFCMSLDKNNKNEDITHPLMVEVFNKILKLHKIAVARYRACQFINMLLKEMGDNESYLDEDICNQIRDVMIERTSDIKPLVRYEAIEVLQRLQDPHDPNDCIIKTYIQCLPDSSSNVRRAIVQAIGLNMTTIPLILGRCLDVDENVRFASYERFSRIPIKVLKLEYRQSVLRNGFKDKNAKIKTLITDTVLSQWFISCESNYFKLILALKLDADENDFKETTFLVEKILDIFFRKKEMCEILDALPLGADKLLVPTELTWEACIFWRCLSEFLRRSENTETDLNDQILPELSFFCFFLRSAYANRSAYKNDWEVVEHDHIMTELLKICQGYDFSDEVGRRELYKLSTELLIDAKLSYKNAVLVVRIFEKLVSNVESFAHEIGTIISEIREPITMQAPSEEMIREKDVKLAELRMKLDIAVYDQETAITNKEFEKAHDLKLQMNTLREQMAQIQKEFETSQSQVRVRKDDIPTLCKCLDLLIALLLSPNIKILPETLQETIQQLVQPLLISNNSEVFQRALKIMGLCSCLDKELAKKSITLFTATIMAHKFMPVYDDETTVTAIYCLTDVIMSFGPDIIESESDIILNQSKKPSKKRLFTESQLEDTVLSQIPSDISFEVIIDTLAEFLDDATAEIREQAGETLVKLMCTGNIRSSMLFSKLVLKWFSPATSKDSQLRQMIGRVFVEYTTEVPSSLEVIEQAYISTIHAVMDAPRSSPLADVDIDLIIRFMSEISRPGNHKYNTGLSAHKNISLLLCQEICNRPNNKSTPYFLKALLLLDLPYDDEVAILDLRKQTDLMLELITEKQYFKYLLKYKRKLEGEMDQLTNTLATNSRATLTSLNTTTADPSNMTTENRITNSSNATRNSILNGARIIPSQQEKTHNTSTTNNDYSKPNKYVSLSVKRKKKGLSLTTPNRNCLPIEEEKSDKMDINNISPIIESPMKENDSSQVQICETTDSDSRSCNSQVKDMRTTRSKRNPRRSNRRK